MRFHGNGYANMATGRDERMNEWTNWSMDFGRHGVRSLVYHVNFPFLVCLHIFILFFTETSATSFS